MFTKTQRKILFAYLVFFVLIVLLERHGFRLDPLTPLELVLFSPIFFAFAVFAIQNESFRGGFSTIDRSDRPLTFWFGVAFALFDGLAFLGWGIRDALR